MVSKILGAPLYHSCEANASINQHASSWAPLHFAVVQGHAKARSYQRHVVNDSTASLGTSIYASCTLRIFHADDGHDALFGDSKRGMKQTEHNLDDTHS